MKDSKGVAGRVDVVKKSFIKGYAIGASDEPVLVELLIDGTVVNHTYATQLYKDRYIGFRFGMENIWAHLCEGQRLEVLGDGKPLEFKTSKDVEYLVPTDGQKCQKNVVDLINAGYLINKKGKMQVPRDANKDWAERVLTHYNKLNDLLQERFGKQCFCFFGVLLGFARDGKILSHDIDLDVAYYSNETDPSLVREEFYRISKYLIEQDEFATPFDYKLQFPGKGISLTPCWFSNAKLYNTFGFAGDAGGLTESDLLPLTCVEHLGHRLHLPNNLSALAEYMYGRWWRYPDSGWQWRQEYRSDPGIQAGRLTSAQVQELSGLRAL